MDKQRYGETESQCERDEKRGEIGVEFDYLMR